MGAQNWLCDLGLVVRIVGEEEEPLVMSHVTHGDFVDRGIEMLDVMLGIAHSGPYFSK